LFTGSVGEIGFGILMSIIDLLRYPDAQRDLLLSEQQVSENQLAWDEQLVMGSSHVYSRLHHETDLTLVSQ
jgi:hypothetical protein